MRRRSRRRPSPGASSTAGAGRAACARRTPRARARRPRAVDAARARRSDAKSGDRARAGVRRVRALPWPGGVARREATPLIRFAEASPSTSAARRVDSKRRPPPSRRPSTCASGGRAMPNASRERRGGAVDFEGASRGCTGPPGSRFEQLLDKMLDTQQVLFDLYLRESPPRRNSRRSLRLAHHLDAEVSTVRVRPPRPELDFATRLADRLSMLERRIDARVSLDADIVRTPTRCARIQPPSTRSASGFRQLRSAASGDCDPSKAQL